MMNRSSEYQVSSIEYLVVRSATIACLNTRYSIPDTPKLRKRPLQPEFRIYVLTAVSDKEKEDFSLRRIVITG